jgi:UDP-glucose 4-epimerase
MLNVWVTGARGYLGSSICRAFANHPYINIVPTSHDSMDLTDQKKVHKFVYDLRINGIIHCSGVGGKRIQSDDADIIYTNLRMFEVIQQCGPVVSFILHFGSGAEYDRSTNIHLAEEEESLYTVPPDHYGLVKSIMNRRIVQSGNASNLRLFGCFDANEEPQRFIKANILRRLKGEPIVIHQNRFMDFVFIDDLIEVVKSYVNPSCNLPKSVNVVYDKKYSLFDIAGIINYIAEGPQSEIIVENRTMGLGYCGSGELLESTLSDIKFVGLEEGIQRTYAELKLRHQHS